MGWAMASRNLEFYLYFLLAPDFIYDYFDF